MNDIIVCPLCRTRVQLIDGATCPACRRDATDADEVDREERIDRIYERIVTAYEAGQTLSQAICEIDHDTTLNPDEIQAARAAFLAEGHRKFLSRGKRQFARGALFLGGGSVATLISIAAPIPLTFVFTGAIACGLVYLVFGATNVVRFKRRFR